MEFLRVPIHALGTRICPHHQARDRTAFLGAEDGISLGRPVQYDWRVDKCARLVVEGKMNRRGDTGPSESRGDRDATDSGSVFNGAANRTTQRRIGEEGKERRLVIDGDAHARTECAPSRVEGLRQQDI